jgi:hypothetical protein
LYVFFLLRIGINPVTCTRHFDTRTTLWSSKPSQNVNWRGGKLSSPSATCLLWQFRTCQYGRVSFNKRSNSVKNEFVRGAAPGYKAWNFSVTRPECSLPRNDSK